MRERHRAEKVLENRVLCIKRETEKHPLTTWALASTKQQDGYFGKLIQGKEFDVLVNSALSTGLWLTGNLDHIAKVVPFLH